MKRQSLVAEDRSWFFRFLELAAAAGLVASVLLVLFQFSFLPDQIPTHFGSNGKPDDYGTKWTIILLPVLSVVVYVGLTILNKYPHAFNFPWRITEEHRARQYELAQTMVTALKAEIIWLFVYLEWSTIRIATGKQHSLHPLFLPIFLMVLFGGIGFYFVRAYRCR